MPNNGPNVILRTVSLSKRYGRLLALDDLNLEVPRGQVYGFLGPNGAGKTTTISLILGLIAATRGYVEMFGLDARAHLSETLRRTGAILEGPSFYPLLSGRDNLRIWGALSGGVEDKRISEVLEIVGLRERGRDKVRTYSQGMKQGLGQMGKTVFVSSHLLSEVEQMCDHVGIVKGGRLVAQESVTTLLRRGEALEMRVTDPERAGQGLTGLGWVDSIRREDNRLGGEAPRERAAE